MQVGEFLTTENAWLRARDTLTGSTRSTDFTDENADGSVDALRPAVAAAVAAPGGSVSVTPLPA
jgi:hypothetical protein